MLTAPLGRIPAKWVLAGEHAVLRGAEAVAVPYPEYGLRLVDSTDEDVSLLPLLSKLAEIRPGAISRTVKIRVQSTIPQGAGLGSSAALCVALARRALLSEGGLDPFRLNELARSLENVFHGESSGMDIAAVSAEGPIGFTRATGSRDLGLKLEELPRFTLHDTGLRASTRACVERVVALARPDLDERMAGAAQEAIQGLLAYRSAKSTDGGRSEALVALAQAIQSAQSCFDEWGLTPPAVRELQAGLQARGALACKLVGAGGGGFCVALWGPQS